MKSFLVSKIWLLVFGMTAFLVSCNQDESTPEEVDAYVEEVVYRIQESGNLGKFGCYELVFPVTVTFPDGSVSEELNSYEEMKEVLKAWRAENGKARVRPVITLPFDVLNEEGDLISVETIEQLRRLRMDCRRTFFENNGPTGHNVRGKFCFRPQFPLTLIFPDGTTETYSDRRSMHQALREWKRNNPGFDVRPVLAFPMNVIMEDGTIVTVNSKEELKALKESCK